MSGIVFGKLALVTGAGSGIGRATCKIMAREGAKVIAVDKNLQAVQETLNTITQNKENSHIGLEANVGSLASVKKLLSEVLNKFNAPPSIIVNCAGITRDNFLLKMSEADFDEVINVNLKGTFLLTQTFANAMVNDKITNGSIINISSIIGKTGNIAQSNYSASKAAVQIFTKSAAKELGKFGIRCNSVLPGFTVTPMTDVIPDKIKNIYLPQIPANRFGKPEEIAEVITFLASERSSYVTGAAIEVTGGY